METLDSMDNNKSVYKLKGIAPIYCINLDGQPERWEFMENQFKYWEIENYTRTVSYTHLTLPTNREV